MQGMIVDSIIAIIILFYVIQGFRKGIILEILGISNIFISVFISFKFSTFIVNMLAQIFNISNIVYTLAPIVVFIISYIFIKLLLFVINLLLKFKSGNNISKIFGSFFGFLKGIILLSMLTITLTTFDINKTLIKDSRLSPYLSSVSQVMFDMAPSTIKNAVAIKISQIKNSVNVW